MSTALYRKYRPDNFDNIIGQNQVIDVLKNQIKENKISHAYIFSGVRGTGKTSTAKVFAKAVNCMNYTEEKGICNECNSCINNQMDTIEIDAASNNSVDNIRALKDTIMYQPNFGKYKVYIIDEVHMLSTGAFNALLKTLEEPPSHVIFILATTELNKIPATILSRCQKFEFKKVSKEDIKLRLRYILESENIEYNDEAIDHIADMSDGGLRDAISMLDQVASYGKINLQNIDFVTGMSSIEQIDKYILALLEKNTLNALTTISYMKSNSVDIKKVPSQIISRLIDIMYIQNDIPRQNVINQEKIQDMIHEYKDVDISDIIVKISDIENEMKYANTPDILFESFTVKQCRSISNNENLSELIKKIEYLENKINNLEKNGLSISNSIEKEEVVIKEEDITKEKRREQKIEQVQTVDNISQEEQESIDTVNSLLGDINDVLRQMKSVNISALLHEGNIRRYVDENIYISYKRSYTFHKNMIEKEENVKILEKAFEKILTKKINIVIVFDDEIIKYDKKDAEQELQSKIKEAFGDVKLEIIEE